MAVRSFGRLMGQRDVSMGIGTIPISEMLVYADVFGVVDVETLIIKLLAMDKAYLDFMVEKKENEKKAAEGPKLIIPR